MALSSRTQRTLLFSFIASISTCGLIGIYILIVGNFGPIEGRVLGTTALIGAASILAMAAAVAWENQRWGALGLCGMIAPAVALLLSLLEIWVFSWRNSFGDFQKTIFSAWVVAVALAHFCLLALPRLHKGFEWVRSITLGVVGVLALLIIATIWIEPDEDLWFRVIGVLAILDVCGTIAVPVLHRISGIHARERVQTTALELILTCPRCGQSQNLPAGRSRCACGLRFRIEIEEEHCPRCGYALYQNTSGVCPECGAPVAEPARSA